MSIIKRRGKRSYNKIELLNQVKKELKIDGMITNACPVPRLPDQMPVDFCINICNNPCQGFMDFEFIIHRCFETGCTIESPCLGCVGEIEKYKVFFRCLKSLDMDVVNRAKSHRHQIEAYLRKHGLKNEDE